MTEVNDGSFDHGSQMTSFYRVRGRYSPGRRLFGGQRSQSHLGGCDQPRLRFWSHAILPGCDDCKLEPVPPTYDNRWRIWRVQAYEAFEALPPWFQSEFSAHSGPTPILLLCLINTRHPGCYIRPASLMKVLGWYHIWLRLLF